MKNKTRLTKEEITFKVLLVAVFAVIACYFVPQAIKTLNPYWLLGFFLFLPLIFWNIQLKRQKVSLAHRKQEMKNTKLNWRVITVVGIVILAGIYFILADVLGGMTGGIAAGMILFACIGFGFMVTHTSQVLGFTPKEHWYGVFFSKKGRK